MRSSCIALLICMLVSLTISDADELDEYVTRTANEFLAPQNRMPGSIRFDVIGENTREEGNSYTVGIRIELLLNGRLMPKYTIGSVGIGNSLREALDAALNDWSALFLTTLKDYLQSSPNVLPIGVFRVYPSAIGFRWAEPSGWVIDTEKRNSKLLRLILPYLERYTENYPAIVYLMLIVDESANARGECRINFEPSNALLDRITELNWPVASERYMLKQLYIIDKQLSKN